MATIKSSTVYLGTPPTEAPVDNKLRTDWNNYISWLDKKGLKGHPSLDKSNLGFKMIEEYRKENPSTLVSKENILPIQKEFQRYREWALEQAKKGQAKLTVAPENFMKALSIIDGIPGQRTTSFQFPESYLTTFQDGKSLGTANLGFSTINK